MILTRIGQKLQGGTFTGFNRIRNQIYGIIVAHKWSEASLQLKIEDSKTPNTRSTMHGFANTQSMNNLAHPAAHYCKNLTVDGNADWYLPSMNELELCYRYLKPSKWENCVGQTYNKNSEVKINYGLNLSSIPKGSPYTEESPSQTIVVDYIKNSSESFSEEFYWSSTETVSVFVLVLIQSFSVGDLYIRNKRLRKV